MKRTTQQSILKFVSMLFAVMIFAITATVSVSAYGYGTNMLTNPQPNKSLTGWSMSDAEWNDGTYGGEFKGTTGKGPLKAWQTVALTENDRIRANNGELEVSASGYFWSQSTSKMTASLKVYAVKADGSESVITSVDYDKRLAFDYHNEKLSAPKKTVPKDTVALKIHASNKDNLVGTPPSMRAFSMILNDIAAPQFISGASKTAAGKYKKGTIISYVLRMSEPVNVENSGTLTFDIGGQTVNAVYQGQSSDKMELNYNITLPTTSTRGNNLLVSPVSVSNLVVTDDAGNSTTVNTEDSLNSSNIYLDNKEPEVVTLSTNASPDAVYKAEEKITFTATFDEYITVTGSPVITLSNGKTAVYKAPATSTDTVLADFVYIAQEGDDTTHLNITAVKLNGIYDAIGNAANTAPGYSETKHNALLENYNISVDSTGPVVTFPEVFDWTKQITEPVIVYDEISGVSEVYGLYSELFSVTPSSENVLPETYIIPCPTQTGEYYMVVKAVDSIGNVSVSHSDTPYKFDFTKPIITPEFTYLETDVETLIKSVNAIANDEHSGIASLTYKWYDKNYVILSGDVSDGVELPDTDGEYKIEFTALDNAGNSAVLTQDGLLTDAMPPEVTFDGIDAVYKKSHTATINVYDAKCGILEYSFIISDESAAPDFDDERWELTNKTEFTTPENTEGIYYLHIKAKDECLNEAVITSPALLVDNSAPSISILPENNLQDIGKSSYTVAINVHDGVSIFDEISLEYVITDSEDLPEDGFEVLNDSSVDVVLETTELYLHIKATDKAGNISFYTSGVFKPDTVSPEGTLRKKDDKYYTNIDTVSLLFSATDDYTENLLMQLMIDDNELEWESFTDEKAIRFDETEGVHTICVRFKDEAGNESEYTDVIEYFYDITPPVITLEYSETNPTNQDVIVTATAIDEISEAEFTSADEKLFTSNGEFEFTAKDEAGNTTKMTAIVANIDKTAPEITFESDEFDGKNHQSATISISANDINDVVNLEYCIDDTEEYMPVENNIVTLEGFDGTKFITVRATDDVGNVATKQSPNVYLDNTSPYGMVIYSPSTRTAQNVEASVSFNEEVTITNNDGSNIYVFTENGEFTFEFCDEAGNTAELEASVTWIDRTKPVGRIALYDMDGNSVDSNTWVNYDLHAIIVPPANTRIDAVYFNGLDVNRAYGIEVIEENAEFIISEYGLLSYSIIDTETLVKGSGEVYIRIDKDAPFVLEEDVLFSEEDWTNNDVTVRITAKDDLSSVEYIDSNTYTFTENGDYEFTFIDQAGNEGYYTVTVDNIDKTAPVAFITYFTGNDEFDNDTFTNKNVKAVINFEDDGLSPVSVTNNDGDDFVKFSDNGSFTFEFKDEAGNTGSITASTSVIDKTPPTGYVVYSTSGWTNNDVTVTLYATDDNGEVIITNNDSEDYVFTENGEFTFEFCDTAGNTALITAFYDKIDKTSPVLTYTLSINESTPFAVYAYVSANERVTYLNNNASSTVKFNSNGNYTIRAIDRAGNTAELEIEVNNISRETTPVYIEYSETDPTSNNVYATIKPQNPEDTIYVTNNNYDKTYKFTENGDFVFTYRNAAGIEGEAVASVTNIDKTAPVVTVSYSHNSITNENVVVTFSCDEEVIYPYYVQNSTFTFTENAVYSIPVSDLVGNTTYVTVETNLIDKNPPVISLASKNVSVKKGSYFEVFDGIEIYDDISGLVDLVVTRDFDTNTEGLYTITYTARDSAGNTAIENVYLSVYDPDKFNVIVNGIMVTTDTVTINSKDVKIEVINAQGNVTAKLENGKKQIGSFKKNKNYITLEESFDKNGIYTIYIQDSERNSKMFWLYLIQDN